jgi:hypothetical protein
MKHAQIWQLTRIEEDDAGIPPPGFNVDMLNNNIYSDPETLSVFAHVFCLSRDDRCAHNLWFLPEYSNEKTELPSARDGAQAIKCSTCLSSAPRDNPPGLRRRKLERRVLVTS